MGFSGKIGFLKLGSATCASTRVRVDYLLPYMDNAIASNNADDLTGCDVVIFQKRYKERDVIFAQWLKSQGRTVIFDLTDPVWDKDYPAVYFPVTDDRKCYFDKMVKLADCITFCTDRLRAMFDSTYPSHNTKVIVDRIDLNLHKSIKFHWPKDRYNILWFGNKFNVYNIDIARDDLERLYKEVDFKLTVIRDKNGITLKPFSFETEYKEWKADTINSEIQKADVTINPHPVNSYKSNNKTIKSMALGLPCLEDNFYINCKRLLTDTDYRKRQAVRGRLEVLGKYDSKMSAREIEGLIDRVKQN